MTKEQYELIKPHKAYIETSLKDMSCPNVGGVLGILKNYHIQLGYGDVRMSCVGCVFNMLKTLHRQITNFETTNNGRNKKGARA